MASQTIDLPRAQYGAVAASFGGNRREWTWLNVQTDPAIDDALKANSNYVRHLAQLRFWRDVSDPDPANHERVIALHIEGSVLGGLSSGEDLSHAFETAGSLTITLDGGASLTCLQSASGDTAEAYVYAADVGAGQFTAAEFDAFWNAMNPGRFQQDGTLIIRDTPPPPADTTAPMLAGAETSADGTHIILQFTEPLDADTAPPATDYAVVVNGNALGHRAAPVHGDKVVIELFSPLEATDVITVAYTKSGNLRLQDHAGNEVETFAAANVVNAVAAGAPTLTVTETGALNPAGTTITLVANRSLDDTSVPAATAFDVQVAGERRTVSSVAVSGTDDKNVVLTLASAVQAGQEVTVAYSRPTTNPLQDLAGLDVGSFPRRYVRALFGSLPLTFISGHRLADGDYPFYFVPVYVAGEQGGHVVEFPLAIDHGGRFWLFDGEFEGSHVRLDPRLENAQCRIENLDGALIHALGRLADWRDGTSYVQYGADFTNFDPAARPAQVRLAFSAHVEPATPNLAFRGRKITGAAFGGRKLTGGAFAGRKFTM